MVKQIYIYISIQIFASCDKYLPVLDLIFYIIIPLNYHKIEKHIKAEIKDLQIFFSTFTLISHQALDQLFLGTDCAAPQSAQKIAEIILLYLAAQFTKTF